jgi:hypothetical protein
VDVTAEKAEGGESRHSFCGSRRYFNRHCLRGRSGVPAAFGRRLVIISTFDTRRLVGATPPNAAAFPSALFIRATRKKPGNFSEAALGNPLWKRH